MTNINLDKISVKSFISDLPRVFNGNFTAIKNFLDNIFNSADRKMTIDNISVNGTIDANSVTAQNLFIKTGSTKISIADLVKRIEDLESKTKNL